MLNIVFRRVHVHAHLLTFWWIWYIVGTVSSWFNYMKCKTYLFYWNFLIVTVINKYSIWINYWSTRRIRTMQKTHTNQIIITDLQLNQHLSKNNGFGIWIYYLSIWWNTLTMAGSCVTAVCCNDVALGGSQTWRSFMSLPRKIMYSKTSSRGGTGWSVGLSSVPNDFTATNFHRHFQHCRNKILKNCRVQTAWDCRGWR